MPGYNRSRPIDRDERVIVCPLAYYLKPKLLPWMLTSPAGHEAKAEARKSEAENEAEAQKVFRGQGPRPQYEDEARHVRTTQCV